MQLQAPMLDVNGIIHVNACRTRHGKINCGHQ